MMWLPSLDQLVCDCVSARTHTCVCVLQERATLCAVSCHGDALVCKQWERVLAALAAADVTPIPADKILADEQVLVSNCYRLAATYV